MRQILTILTVLVSLAMVNGCSKCSRDPAPPVPATEPAATGPEDMHGNPGLAQPGANDPAGTELPPDDAQPPTGAEEDKD